MTLGRPLPRPQLFLGSFLQPLPLDGYSKKALQSLASVLNFPISSANWFSCLNPPVRVVSAFQYGIPHSREGQVMLQFFGLVWNGRGRTLSREAPTTRGY